ncbi:MAG TPA: hypothetical protein VLM85_02995 [Polyangiaceae bacterium]|nr:hypothetical protein [Polyangiaceae bacterium]
MATALEMPEATRKPDGVVLEPPPALPATEERGDSQSGVLALRQPVGDEQIVDVVRSYIRCFVKRDSEGFVDLLGADAVNLENRQARGALIQDFTHRIQQHQADFAKLEGVDVARFDHMERYAAEDLGPHTDPPRPPMMRPGDVYARVPLNPTQASNGNPLFHSMLVMLLRRGADHKLHIVAVAELDAP